MPFRLTIIGVGLLGGSLGLAVRGRVKDCQIIGCAHREKSLVQATERGAIDRWTLDPADAVAGADIVVVCTPVSLIEQWLGVISPHLSENTIVTDVGSTKRTIVDAGERLIRPPARFVGSHPMAGGAQTGVAVARADLFEGATCIVTRTDRTEHTAADRIEHFWETLGMRIVRHDPDEHDRLVALVSHLPHAVAAALVACQSPESINLRGKGFTDTTRIAAGDAQLWRDIFTDNSGHVVASIDQMIERLQTVRAMIESKDATTLEAWLKQQASVRDSI